MSFRDCINRAVRGGEMDEERARRILEEYDDAFQSFRESTGHTQADVQAARAVVDRAKQEAAYKRRITQLQAAANTRNVERMEQHRDITGNTAPWAFPGALITSKRGAGGETLEGKYQAVRRKFRGQMTESAREFRANLIGQRRNRETLQKMVREVFGESTGDEGAARLAQAWKNVAEQARTRRNAAGGRTGKREDWGLPQMHSTDRVREAGYDEWRATILPKLDLDAMGREWNNGVPFNERTIEPVLYDAFEAIRTDGYSRREPTGRRGTALYNQRADHRFFKFRTADDWMAYNERFGSGNDPFRVMMGHLDGMAHDIAMMEVLGPNPNFAFQHLLDAGRSMAARSADPQALPKARRSTKAAEDLYDRFTGVTNAPVNEKWARRFASVRNYMTSAHLGSAIISQMTDLNHARLAASFMGMSQLGSFRQVGRLVRSKRLRDEAAEAGLIFENAVDIGNAAARYELEQVHSEVSARMGDFTIRASGMGFVTETQRQAFGLHMMNTAAKDWHGRAFGQLDERTQRGLSAYGISARDWEAIRQAPVHEQSDGLRVLRPQDIEEAAGQTIADRYMEMIVNQIEFAVPSTDIYGRSMVLGASQPGTIVGEAARFGLQFKAFPITLMVTQFGRIMDTAMQGRRMDALTYAAGLFVGNTVLGAMAVQLKDLSRGRDPREMDSAQFWMAAMAQGGGAGIFGDFLFADQNRFGGGIASTLAGPGVGFANDAIRSTVGNVQLAAQGEDTRFGDDMVGMLRRYTPGGSLWYARMAYEREVLDMIQSVIDPDAHRSFRRRARSADDFGTEYFFEPGASVIRDQGRIRAPEFGNVAGGR